MNPNLGPQFPPIYQSDLTAGGVESGRAPKVSPEEFQESAGRGQKIVQMAQKTPAGTGGLDSNWDQIKSHAFNQSRNEWGGGTYSAKDGQPMKPDADAYALTARTGSQESVHVPIGASPEEFGSAMDKARQTFGGNFGQHATHLGVFHDADAGRIDIDPVMVTPSRQQAQDAGAYTRATGGAYHFQSGDGYWPPSISDELRGT